jgi:hypothetical protein
MDPQSPSGRNGSVRCRAIQFSRVKGGKRDAAIGWHRRGKTTRQHVSGGCLGNHFCRDMFRLPTYGCGWSLRAVVVLNRTIINFFVYRTSRSINASLFFVATSSSRLRVLSFGARCNKRLYDYQTLQSDEGPGHLDCINTAVRRGPQYQGPPMPR